MAAKTDHGEEVVNPSICMRSGWFFKQGSRDLRKVLPPARRQLFWWSLASFIFVLLLMVFVTAMDFGLGKLALLIFG